MVSTLKLCLLECYGAYYSMFCKLFFELNWCCLSLYSNSVVISILLYAESILGIFVFKQSTNFPCKCF